MNEIWHVGVLRIVTHPELHVTLYDKFINCKFWLCCPSATKARVDTQKREKTRAHAADSCFSALDELVPSWRDPDMKYFVIDSDFSFNNRRKTSRAGNNCGIVSRSGYI